MEFLRKIGLRDTATPKEKLLRRLVPDNLLAGQREAQRHHLCAFLGLATGREETLLNLSVGLKLLQIKIDESKGIKKGVSKWIPDIFTLEYDSNETKRLRYEADLLGEYTTDFVDRNFPSMQKAKARNIQIAVNMLFAQTRFVSARSQTANQAMNPQTIKEWAERWKPVINQAAVDLTNGAQ